MTRLAIGKTCELLAVAKDKLDLETRAISLNQFATIQLQISRSQDHVTGFFLV